MVLRGATLIGAGLVPGMAAAQDRLGVDVSASAGVSTNPFLRAGSTPTTGTGTIDVRPSYTLQRPLTTVRLEADAQFTKYTGDYDHNENYTLQGSASHKLSERTSITGAVSYLNSLVGSFVDSRVPVGVPVIDTGLPVYVNDPALGGIGQRRQSYQASAGLSSLLSSRDQVNVQLSASVNRFGGLLFSDYNYYSPTVGYSRALGPGFNVGASFTLGRTDYRGTGIGDATVYQPSLTVSRSLNERWTLDAAAGAAIATVREPTGIDRSSTAFNGTLNVCRRDSRWNACLSASRQTLPSAFQGVRTQTSASAFAGYRATAKDDVSLVASYSHAGNPVQQLVIGGPRVGSDDYVTLTGNLSHRFRPRLSGFVSGGYNKSFGNDLFRRNANFTAQLGVNYRFGARQ